MGYEITDVPPLMTAGELTDRRQQAGLTKRDLAKKLGIDDTQVIRWERGEAEPSIARRRQLEEVLGNE